MNLSELRKRHQKRHEMANSVIVQHIGPFFRKQVVDVLNGIPNSQPLSHVNVGAAYNLVHATAKLRTQLRIIQAVALKAAEESLEDFSQPLVLQAKQWKPLEAAVTKATDEYVAQPFWVSVTARAIDLARAAVKRIEMKSPITEDRVAEVKRYLFDMMIEIQKRRIHAMAAAESNHAINLGVYMAGQIGYESGAAPVRIVEESGGGGYLGVLDFGGGQMPSRTSRVQNVMPSSQPLQAEQVKTWVTMDDELVRETHAALHLKSIPHGSRFSVGGHVAMYPSDSRLPTQERQGCRCFLVNGTVVDK